ncbi:MAG: hypothetical protein IT384_22820 [Deltaproteobacteria bacterium]|nr:hypothetical protein [Deltaproteobacteria bacterium]
MDPRAFQLALWAGVGLVATAHAEGEPVTPAPSPSLLGLEPHAIGGYGGAYFKVSALQGHAVVLGGRPLSVVTIDQVFGVGIILSASEGDVGGLQILHASPFFEVDLFPRGPIHLSPGLMLHAGTVIYDAVGAPRARSAWLGLEPQIAIICSGPARWFDRGSASWRRSVGWRGASAARRTSRAAASWSSSRPPVSSSASPSSCGSPPA